MSLNAKLGCVLFLLVGTFVSVGVYIGTRGFSSYKELDTVGIETQGMAKFKGYRRIGGETVSAASARHKLQSPRAIERAEARVQFAACVVSYWYEVDGKTYRLSQDMPTKILEEHDWRDFAEEPRHRPNCGIR